MFVDVLIADKELIKKTGLFEEMRELDKVWPGIVDSARDCYAYNLSGTSVDVYKAHWNHWLKFAQHAGYDAADKITEDKLCMWMVYAAGFATRRISPRSVGNYLVGIRHFMQELGMGDPAKWLKPYRILRGLKRRAAQVERKEKKLALTMKWVRLIVGRLKEHDQFRGDNLMCVAVMVQALIGLHRMGELTASAENREDGPLVSHWNPTARTLLLPRSKEDIFGVGIVVGYPEGKLVPEELNVAHLIRHHHEERQSRLGAACLAPSEQLYRREDGKAVTRSYWVRWLRQQLRHHMPKSELRRYAGHSPRRGGATMLADAGVPQYVVKILGRWSSDCFLSYVQMQPQVRAQHALVMYTNMAQQE